MAPGNCETCLGARGCCEASVGFVGEGYDDDVGEVFSSTGLDGLKLAMIRSRKSKVNSSYLTCGMWLMVSVSTSFVFE